jgi:hypothetical protein
MLLVIRHPQAKKSRKLLVKRSFANERDVNIAAK